MIEQTNRLLENHVMRILILFLLFINSALASKELALSFDDAPMGESAHMKSEERTKLLISKLADLKVPPVVIFANPCKGDSSKRSFDQLKLYKEAGHFLGNHTCTHPRLDEVGFTKYSEDALKADQLLSKLFDSQKFFRFPYLNEGTDVIERDNMRSWLRNNRYRNGFVSIDNDDYIFSFKINQAKSLGKKIDYEKVKILFIDHILKAVTFYDQLAVNQLGYSPKHVLLLHEMDATVMFLDSLVKELRSQGWKIISVSEAYKDKLYLQEPKSTYANNGIIAQLVHDKTGKKERIDSFDTLKANLNLLLGL